MKENKRSIPIIKALIIFSLLVFITSLIYVNFFKTNRTVEIREAAVYSKELRRRIAIKEFVDYVDKQPNVTFNRKYTSFALLKLKKAVDVIALSINYEFQYADLIIAESDIERIAKEKLFSTQSYYLKHATGILSNALGKIQRQKYPELKKEVDELSALSGKFNGTDLKLDQDQKIHEFLNKALDLLTSMR